MVHYYRFPSTILVTRNTCRVSIGNPQGNRLLAFCRVTLPFTRTGNSTETTFPSLVSRANHPQGSSSLPKSCSSQSNQPFSSCFPLPWKTQRQMSKSMFTLTRPLDWRLLKSFFCTAYRKASDAASSRWFDGFLGWVNSRKQALFRFFFGSTVHSHLEQPFHFMRKPLLWNKKQWCEIEVKQRAEGGASFNS